MASFTFFAAPASGPSFSAGNAKRDEKSNQYSVRNSEDRKVALAQHVAPAASQANKKLSLAAIRKGLSPEGLARLNSYEQNMSARQSQEAAISAGDSRSSTFFANPAQRPSLSPTFTQVAKKEDDNNEFGPRDSQIRQDAANQYLNPVASMQAGIVDAATLRQALTAAQQATIDSYNENAEALNPQQPQLGLSR